MLARKLKSIEVRLRKNLALPAPVFKILHPHKKPFTCPICDYEGPFRDSVGRWLTKLDSQCPKCLSTERVRIEWLAILDALKVAKRGRAIHFAPELGLVRLLRSEFEQYEISDFTLPNADHRADLTDLHFSDQTFDFLIASHVLEHIKEDCQALGEISRVLKPGGIAILPVPTIGEQTIEYDAPRPEEAGHVRSPGSDYYERYRPYFKKVEVKSSGSYASKYQLLSRPAGTTDLNPAYVPICYA